MKLSLSFLLSCLLSIACSQNLLLSLKNEQGEPVSCATVKNLSSGKTYVLDAEGEVYYPLYSEKDSLEIQALSYQTTIFVLDRSMKSPVNISIKSTYQELALVEVYGAGAAAFGFQSKSLAASSVFLDKKALSKLESNDINQILYTIPGVQIQQEDGYGLRPNIGMRGTGVERSSKITLMEDGVLIAPAPYAASAAYYFPSMDHIEGIEVLKGSSQIAYGPQSNGGAINLISDRIPDDFSVNAKVSLGSFLTRKVQGSVGDSQEHFGYLLKATYFGSNGFKNLPNGNNTGFDKSDILAKLRFNTKSDAKIFQSFTVKYAYTQENTKETYLGITLSDFEQDPLQRYAASALDNIQSTHTQIQANHLIVPLKKLSISTTAYLNKFSRNWFKLDKVSVDGSTKVGIADVFEDEALYAAELDLMRGTTFLESNQLFIRNNNRAYTSKGIQTNALYNFETKIVEHKVQLGLRLHQDEMDRFQWDDVYTMTAESLELLAEGEPGTESNRIEGAKAFAGFLQYAVKIKNFSFSSALRLEHMHFTKNDFGKNDPSRTGANEVITENKETVLLPGFSASYQYVKNNFFFAGIHKGFSPPNANEETKAEESWNFETGAKGMFKGLAYEAIFFMNRYTNLLGSDLSAVGGGGSTELFNGGKVHVYGAEVLLSYNVLAKFSSKLKLPLVASYTFTDARFQSSFESDGPWGTVAKNDYLPYISQHQFSTQLGVEHKRFDLNLIFKALSAMRTSPGQGDLEKDHATPFFYQLDFLARYKINRMFTVFAKANNFTNNVQRIAKHPSGWRPNMPAYVEGGVSFAF
ncbi:MAG: TonB-dependent receptor [Chitinophagales bacterium]